jgi:hypothetical protein
MEKGRERYLASRLSYLAHPFVQLVTWSFTHTYFLGHIGLLRCLNRKLLKCLE